MVLAAIAAALAGLLAVASVAGTAAPAGSPAPARFALADGSIGCSYADGAVRCAVAGSSTGRRLTNEGGVRAVEGLDALESRSSVRLLPGERWVHGGLSCLAGRASLTCTASGAEITLHA